MTEQLMSLAHGRVLRLQTQRMIFKESSQHFGTPSDEEKRAFTRVLQGHIAIDTSVFPVGTTGKSLDCPC